MLQIDLSSFVKAGISSLVCLGCDMLRTIERLVKQQLPPLITELYCCFAGAVTFCCVLAFCGRVWDSDVKTVGSLLSKSTVWSQADVFQSLTSWLGFS